MTEERESGWIIIGLIALFYAALYALNFWLPLTHSNYVTRMWNWSQAVLAIGAVAVLFSKWRAIDLKNAIIGMVVGLLSGLGHALRDPSFLASFLEGLAVWLTFVAGTALFKGLETYRTTAFQPPLGNIGRSLLLGITFAIPLAIVNNLYFYMNSGSVQFQNPYYSALEALSPGISEESIFRLFILAFCLSLLRGSAHPRLALTASIALAVIPHSLNHLPDLFLDNAPMGLFMLAATSLLFGLPMALLQLKKNFETAVAFHWFIDFARFLFGY